MFDEVNGNHCDADLLAPIVIECLAPRLVGCELGGAKYVLVEASEGDAIHYRDACSRAVRQTDGRITFERLGEADTILLSRCLCYADEGGQPKLEQHGRHSDYLRVPLQTIKGWNQKAARKLVERLKRVSGLDDLTERQIETQIEELKGKLAALREGKEKNDPSTAGTRDTSGSVPS